MKPVLSVKKSWLDVMHLDAEPERVFPLLCPVLEYDWIEDWSCELLHSVSGVAEEGCIFRTQFKVEGKMTWVVSRYEAPWRIEFAGFVPGSHIMRLKLKLRPEGAGTSLSWTREFTATDAAGEKWVAAYTEGEHNTMMTRLERMLKYYLNTGTMLHMADVEAQPVQ